MSKSKACVKETSAPKFADGDVGDVKPLIILSHRDLDSEFIGEVPERDDF